MDEAIPKITEGCSGDCRISSGGSVITLTAWAPIFDKHGRQTNADPNMRTTVYHCHTCKRRWTAITGGGKALAVTLDTPSPP